MILGPNSVFSKHQNKAEIQNLDDFKVLINDFPGIRPLQPQRPHRPLQPQRPHRPLQPLWPQQPLKPYFNKELPDLDD